MNNLGEFLQITQLGMGIEMKVFCLQEPPFCITAPLQTFVFKKQVKKQGWKVSVGKSKDSYVILDKLLDLFNWTINIIEMIAIGHTLYNCWEDEIGKCHKVEERL